MPDHRRREHKPTGTFAERFWAKVDTRGDDECWPWLGRVTRTGYGSALSEERNERTGRRKGTTAHRVAYQLAIGPIPDGMEIDHVAARGCTRRDCCNPAHLEAVTPTENKRRSRGNSCSRGHIYPHNVYRDPSTGQRVCNVCRAERRAAKGAKLRTCSVCGEKGHTKRTCPDAPSKT